MGGYLEAGSSDAPVELIVLTAPAPEAVGHPVALTETGSITCPILPGRSLASCHSEYPAQAGPGPLSWQLGTDTPRCLQFPQPLQYWGDSQCTPVHLLVLMGP